MSQASSQSELLLTPLGICVDTVGAGASEGMSAESAGALEERLADKKVSSAVQNNAQSLIINKCVYYFITTGFQTPES